MQTSQRPAVVEQVFVTRDFDEAVLVLPEVLQAGGLRIERSWVPTARRHYGTVHAWEFPATWTDGSAGGRATVALVPTGRLTELIVRLEPSGRRWRPTATQRGLDGVVRAVRRVLEDAPLPARPLVAPGRVEERARAAVPAGASTTAGPRRSRLRDLVAGLATVAIEPGRG